MVVIERKLNEKRQNARWACLPSSLLLENKILSLTHLLTHCVCACFVCCVFASPPPLLITCVYVNLSVYYDNPHIIIMCAVFFLLIFCFVFQHFTSSIPHKKEKKTLPV